MRNPAGTKVRRTRAGRTAALVALLVLVTCAGCGTNAAPLSAARPGVQALRIMNYYPADAPWTLMWQHYDHARTVRDFAGIRSLGANTVRIIVQPYSVGWPTVDARGEAQLNDMIASARSAGLWVQLTLFDWWHRFGSLQASRHWLSSLFGGLHDAGRIALIEIRNEIDPSSPAVIRWTRAMLVYCRVLTLASVPLTVSVRGTGDGRLITTLLRQLPPFVLPVIDVHLYADAAQDAVVLSAARAMAQGRPIIVGEAGYSTLPGDAVTDSQQAEFYRRTWGVIGTFGIRYFGAWTFTDFAPSAVSALGLSPGQADFGLQRVDGTWKPAADIVKAMFAAGPG